MNTEQDLRSRGIGIIERALAVRADIPEGARKHLAEKWVDDLAATPPHLVGHVLNGKLADPATQEVIRAHGGGQQAARPPSFAEGVRAKMASNEPITDPAERLAAAAISRKQTGGPVRFREVK